MKVWDALGDRGATCQETTDEGTIMKLYPTIHSALPYGLPQYEIRGTQVYPTVNNARDTFGLPVFDRRGSHLYPTVHNQTHSYGLPALEVRGNQLYPTIHNQVEPYGLPVFELR